MKNKLKVLLPLLFVIALLAVMSFAVNAEECEHSITHVEAVEPKCHTEGNVEYWYCFNCEQYWLDEAQTKLTVKNMLRIPQLNDESDDVFIEYKAPTCTEDGNYDYWYCDECGRIWNDAYMTNIGLPRGFPVIPALGHEWSEWVVTHTPGCSEIAVWRGIQKRSCSVCGETETEYIDPVHSNIVFVEAQEATCERPGNIAHYACTVCSSYWLDAELKEEVSDWEVFIEEPHNIIFLERKEATCEEVGWFAHYYCPDCGYRRMPGEMSLTVYPVFSRSHYWGEWSEDIAPTLYEEGREIRYCIYDDCQKSDTRTIPKLDFNITSDNYTVSMTCASKIDYIRYAPGVYETSKELRAAEGMVSVNRAHVEAGSTGDVYSKEMKDGGVYTFWVRFTDGNTVMQQLDLTKMTQSIAVNGLQMTVKNLYGVKDYFIVKGKVTSYEEFKGDYIVRVTSERINGAKDYTYTLKEPGMYTVYVRYDDPEREDLVLHRNILVTIPKITLNGLQMTVSDLKLPKVIRVAPGEWETAGEVKRAEGCRNFTNATAIKFAENYTVQFKESGVYTVAIELYNGLVVVETVEITRREPTMVRDGNTITFGDLDGLYVIRYAPGEFTYAGDIKRAEGAKFIRPSAIDENGEISFDIGDGVYTVCVQYNDGSYNYFTVNKNISISERYGITVDSSNIHVDRMPSLGAPNYFGKVSLSVSLDSSIYEVNELPEIKVSVELLDSPVSSDLIRYDGSDELIYVLPIPDDPYGFGGIHEWIYENITSDTHEIEMMVTVTIGDASKVFIVNPELSFTY